jgi:hypothetical protein
MSDPYRSPDSPALTQTLTDHSATAIVPDKTQIKDIEKQIKGKNKELKILAKELRSKKKKRSGALITEDIMKLNNDVAVLSNLINLSISA